MQAAEVSSSARARRLKILKRSLYVLISFLCMGSFSESIIAYFNSSFSKVYNDWLNGTQISTIILSLLVMSILIFHPENPNRLNRYKLFAFFLLVIGCAQVICLTGVGALKHLPSWELSISSSVCFMISTIVLTGETFSAALRLKKNNEKEITSKQKIGANLLIASAAQIVGTAGFVIQSVTGGSRLGWSYVILICFIIGVASSVILFKDDLEKLYNEYFTKGNIDNSKQAALIKLVPIGIL